MGQPGKVMCGDVWCRGVESIGHPVTLSWRVSHYLHKDSRARALPAEMDGESHLSHHELTKNLPIHMDHVLPL